MTFIDENTSREDLQVAILNERSLYAMVDESRFLDDGYTDGELREIIRAWVEAGDECGGAA